ncbi:M56 family metallopeptidase [Parasphingorhabdus sp. JC815]|uniref:M56 family metallopeptidase n=1 Tax=Parasphingorhabdus sp. JC815 TaxID=3232140 RepID=UPI00345ADBF9
MTNWVMDTMVSMTLLMALVLMVRKPVSHYFGAHIAYLLWALPLARLFMPTLTIKAPAPVETMQTSAQTAAASPLFSDIAIVASDKSAAVSALGSIDWMMVALVVWIGGAGMLFISKLAGYFQFREDIVSDGKLVGRHGRIKILETAAVGGPLAFGLLEKYIAVPTNFFRDFAPRERELALEHEISHHESGDLMANFVGLLVLSLHWFNPVAWYAWIAFRQDQETACDARVLQNGGRELRGVYGRTIAKSVSGHQLGLASPLNQKNKIKDRLKMLGQTEKSVLRKRMGALMVGVSTVVALPLTATVTYAVEVQPDEDQIGNSVAVVSAGAGNDYNTGDSRYSLSENNQQKQEMTSTLQKVGAPHSANLPHMAPVEPVNSDSLKSRNFDPADGNQAITILNGEKDWGKVIANGDEFVHKIKHNGRTIILRTNKDLNKDEVRKMVEEAEESRREAEESLKQSEIERHAIRAKLAEAAREMKQVENEWKKKRSAKAPLDHETRLEIERAFREAQHEIEKAVKEAEYEARQAEREARRIGQEKAIKTQTVAGRFWSASQISFNSSFASANNANRSMSVNSAKPECTSVNIAAVTTGGMGNLVWANMTGCPIQEKQPLLKNALKIVEHEQIKTAACNEKDGMHTAKVEA